MTTTTHQDGATTRGETLAMAMELSVSSWGLFFSVGFGQRPRERKITAGDLQALEREISRAKQRFGLQPEAPVVSCYEAGRDGFWLHRALECQAVENLVVDSSSIEMPRRGRRAKTDRLDGQKLLGMLLRYLAGERAVWRVVRVPSEEHEDARHLHRALEAVKRERTRSTNRIKGLLASRGIRLGVRRCVKIDLEKVREWNGSPLPPGLVARVRVELERVQLLDEQLRAAERERTRQLRVKRGQKASTAQAQIAKLTRLKGIGPVGASVPVYEVFSWRKIRNRRELGAMMGLTPLPWNSGNLRRDQGISKAGSPRLRSLAVELAWGWLRYQPSSDLALWYQRRFGHGSSRLRRIGIVALARKLMVALWRYLEADELPAGALLKA